MPLIWNQGVHVRSFIWLLLALSLTSTAYAAKDQEVRPEVAKPLQAAQKALQAEHYSEALQKIGEAEKVDHLSSYESYVVERLRANASIGLGDMAGAYQAYEIILNSPELPTDEKQQVLGATARLAYANKEYAKTVDYIRQFRDLGGADPRTLDLLPQALYLNNDFAGAKVELAERLRQVQSTGHAPSDIDLRLYLNCMAKLDDKPGYREALKLMVTYHPGVDYWQELITRTAAQPGFSPRFALDTYRLKNATGTIELAEEYTDATQLALAAGLPGEAQRYIDEGYQKGLLGQGSNTAAHRALKEQVAKKIAEDKRTLAEGEKSAASQSTGDALIATGLDYVGYGQIDKGLALIEQGAAKAKLAKPDDAKLHLGYARWLAGKAAEADEAWRSVGGQDGSQDLAELWLLLKPAAK